MAAQFIASVSMMFKTLAAVCMRMCTRHLGVFVETAKADFNELFAALVGPRP